MSTQTVASARACFRHPDREASVACQRCSRPICPECMVPAPVGFQCPECVADAAKRTRQPMLARTGTPYLTYAIIVINAVVAAVSLAASEEWLRGAAGPIGVRGGLMGGGLARIDGQLQLVGVDEGEWYRIFTGAFIHGGPIHLGFNMLILWQIGAILEPTLGRGRFLLLYGVSVLGGSFGALLITPNALTVGASGGVFGLMGALFVAQRMGAVSSFGTSVGGLIVINLILTAVIPGISVGGHVGGLAAGTAVGAALFVYEKRRLPAIIPVAMASALGFVLFMGCFWAAAQWRDPLF